MTTKRTYHQHASTALHEAGYAVAALALGRLYDQISIGAPDRVYPANGPTASTFIPHDRVSFDEKLRWVRAVC